ncbi:uncharacterized protein MAL13P1.336-like [Uloborus diversus]|uniref:uncharacterized protein MAL13P1.336-like n=1 Tax=Uloborus diversus TaxID=327109 RepID=UPI002409718C|nr:uncharacterized protein MAL13P1.336-like [Uloborus diversus]
MIQSDMFHYYKLKKFLTAVAFARALGRRPTILPIPIPVPIPIQQNEVIRIPSQKGGGKTVVALSGGGGGGSQKFPTGISSLLTGGPLTSLTSAFTGSSNFGYSLPGISTSESGIQTNGANVIDLSSLSSANNVIRTSSSNSGANLGGTRIMVVDPQTLGNLLNSANTANGGSPQIQFANNLGNNLGNSFQFDNGLGNNFGDLESAFTLNTPQRIRIPWYSDFPNRKIPFKFRSGRMRNRDGSRQEFEMDPNEFDNRHPSNKNRYKNNSNRYTNNNRYRNQNRNTDSNWESTSSHQHVQKKPIPVGERFQARY